jgi:hypothetical protein
MNANGHVAILFTPSVNSIPAPPGIVWRTVCWTRPAARRHLRHDNKAKCFTCGSDPNQTISNSYAVKAEVASRSPTLVRDFSTDQCGAETVHQQRVTAEEVWLNEGLSHIAETPLL